jgi:hypothetical protein
LMLSVQHVFNNSSPPFAMRRALCFSFRIH